jgi:hypothetical protein
MKILYKILLIILSSAIYCSIFCSAVLLLFVFVIGPAVVAYDPPEDIGDNYYLYDHDIRMELVKKLNNGADSQIIMGGIVDYKYDGRYFIAYRELSEQVRNEFLTYDYDEIMNGPSWQYWIIDKKRNICLGPLSKDTYLLKRIEMKVPPNLKLKK